MGLNFILSAEVSNYLFILMLYLLEHLLAFILLVYASKLFVFCFADRSQQERLQIRVWVDSWRIESLAQMLYSYISYKLTLGRLPTGSLFSSDTAFPMKNENNRFLPSLGDNFFVFLVRSLISRCNSYGRCAY